MSFELSKKNGELKQVITNRGFETRNISTMWCIRKANEIYNWEDFDTIKISTDDCIKYDNNYAYSFYGDYPEESLIPDFNFHCWPQVGLDDFDEIKEQIHQAGLEKPLTSWIGWFGVVSNLEVRKKFFEIAEQHKKLFKVRDNRYWRRRGTKKIDGIHRDVDVLQTHNYMSLVTQVKEHKFLIDMEGRGYSGRVKYFFWSHRPVLLIDRPYKEYFFKYLIPWKHYIPVKRDLSDLIEKAEWCNENYEKALEIAENAYEFSKKHLTREACYARWNEIIKNEINKQKNKE